MELAQEIKALESLSHVRLTVSQDDSMRVPIGDEAFDRRVRLLEELDVRVVHGSLDDTTYLDLVAAADAAWLPYNPATFAFRTSGIFVDALILGVPVVAPVGTAIAEEIRAKNLGTTYTYDDIGSLTQAILEIVSRRSEYRAQLEKLAPAHRELYSPDRLIEFFEGIQAEGSLAASWKMQIKLEVGRELEWLQRRRDRAVQISTEVARDDLRRVTEQGLDSLDKKSRSIAALESQLQALIPSSRVQ